MSPTAWFLVAATVLLAGVLAVLLRPMWQEPRRVLAAVALAFGLGAVALYRLVGTPDALDAQRLAMPQTLDDAIGQLQAALAKDPRQPEGWRLLGQALTTEQRYAEARACAASTSTSGSRGDSFTACAYASRASA
jgi:cytochrome c-type biogenesis protein CcmH